MRGGPRRRVVRKARGTPSTQVVFTGHEKIHVARQLKMLESIVEDMNGRAQSEFGEPAREVPIGAHGDDGTGNGLREHQRLIAGRVDIGERV
jgi:hypothetical protein